MSNHSLEDVFRRNLTSIHQVGEIHSIRLVQSGPRLLLKSDVPKMPGPTIRRIKKSWNIARRVTSWARIISHKMYQTTLHRLNAWAYYPSNTSLQTSDSISVRVPLFRNRMSLESRTMNESKKRSGASEPISIQTATKPTRSMKFQLIVNVHYIWPLDMSSMSYRSRIKRQHLECCD